MLLHLGDAPPPPLDGGLLQVVSVPAVEHHGAPRLGHPMTYDAGKIHSEKSIGKRAAPDIRKNE